MLTTILLSIAAGIIIFAVLLISISSASRSRLPYLEDDDEMYDVIGVNGVRMMKPCGILTVASISAYFIINAAPIAMTVLITILAATIGNFAMLFLFLSRAEKKITNRGECMNVCSVVVSCVDILIISVFGVLILNTLNVI